MATDNAPAGWLTDYVHGGRGKNGKIGIILVHGFTGSPASMRPWAHYFQELGYTIRVPRIPGHGTKWEDLNQVKWQEWPDRVQRDIDDLSKTCEKIFICGLSMGGGNTLYVAAKNQGTISGIVLVNPMIHIPGVKIKFGRLWAKLKAGMPSVGDDIKKPGVTEWGYDVLPTAGVVQLYEFLKKSRSYLGSVKTPLLLFHSVDDHVLEVTNTEIIMEEIGSNEKNRIELLNSYHVATMDFDAEMIFENSRVFVERLSG